ncbi:MAG TPA: hypothetical protein VN408_42700 [Actinoplanes sp.]|nr:hypothetical protein [Actinoplanes sp.]
MSVLAKIGAFAGGCAIVLGLAACSSSETTDQPATSTGSAPVATAASTEPAATTSAEPAAATDKPAGGATAASGAGAQPMGSTQLIKTATFEAKVTVTEADEPRTEELGDPAYAIDVRAQVTRGIYPAGSIEVKFVYANGAANTRIQDPNAPHLAAELVAPSDETERYRYEHPAGAGVGQGARITISQDGKVLATWLT